MTGEGKEKDSKDAPNSVCTGSLAAKFSEKKVEDIQQQDNDNQEQKKSVKGGIDATKPKSATLEAEHSVTEMDKDEDLNVNEGHEKAANVTPIAIRSKVEVKKDGVTSVRRKIDKATSNTPMTALSIKKGRKDVDFNKGKDIQKTMKDSKAAGTSKGSNSPTKKLFEHKTKLASKANKNQISKSPANTDLSSSRTKATTRDHTSKTTVNAESKSPRTKAHAGLPVLKSPASSDSYRKPANKKILSPSKAFFISATPIKPCGFRLPVKSLQASKLNPDEKKTMDAKDTKSKTKARTSKNLLQDPKINIENQKQILNSKEIKTKIVANPTQPLLYDLKLKDVGETELKPKVSSSKPLLKDPRSEDIDEGKKQLESKLTEPNTEVRVFKPLSLVPKLKHIDEQIQKFDLNETDLNTEVCSSKPLRCPRLKDNDEQKPLDSKITEPGTELSTRKPLFQDFELKNIDNQKQPLESKITAQNTVVSASKPLLQDSMILAIDENFKNLHLNTSKMEHDASLVNQDQLNEPQDKDNENVINLRGDVNLSFEFDNQSNKIILVDNKFRYNVNENQKITFNIGGNAEISFIGSKASISTHRCQIDCSMQRNRVVFSLTESAPISDSLPESQISSEIQQSLQDSFNNFVTNIKTTCENFELSFLKSLN